MIAWILEQTFRQWRQTQNCLVKTGDEWAAYQICCVFPAIDLTWKETEPKFAILACITAHTWLLSDQKPTGFLSDSGHVHAVMHAGIDNPLWRGKRSRNSRRSRNFTYLIRGSWTRIPHASGIIPVKFQSLFMSRPALWLIIYAVSRFIVNKFAQ